MLDILVASGTKERGREIVRETETERGTEIVGPRVEGHDHLTSGIGGAPDPIHLLIGLHGDGQLRPPQLRRGREKRREFPHLRTSAALASHL